METYKSILDYYVKTATAKSEEDVINLLTTLSPSDDKIEMGKVYTEVIGYNPITYFDSNQLKRKLFEICSKLPNRERDIILEKADIIVSRSVEYKDKLNDNLWAFNLDRGAKDILDENTYNIFLSTVKSTGYNHIVLDSSLGSVLETISNSPNSADTRSIVNDLDVIDIDDDDEETTLGDFDIDDEEDEDIEDEDYDIDY